MKNNTRSDIVIGMKHIDNADNLQAALKIVKKITGRGGDAELLIRVNGRMISAGKLGHDVDMFQSLFSWMALFNGSFSFPPFLSTISSIWSNLFSLQLIGLITLIPRLLVPNFPDHFSILLYFSNNCYCSSFTHKYFYNSSQCTGPYASSSPAASPSL